jgi:ubiquinone/menaquinone biosynthesis C-methylase UbiE
MTKTLAERTLRKYRGKMASGYEAKRKKQQRWALENETVARMLKENLKRHDSVMDVPVGTGRFFDVYKQMSLKVCGIDSSEEMLRLARKKSYRAELEVGDARCLEYHDRSYTAVVCVRFLDLIDEKAMRQVVEQITRVADRMIVCTIRLGPKYVCKSNTATHDQRKFKALITSCGWRIAETVSVFEQGWQILRLARGDRP